MRKKEINWKVSSFFTLFCCVLGLFTSTSISAQQTTLTPEPCNQGCTAKDLKLKRAYLVSKDQNGNVIPLQGCVSGNTVTVYLAVELQTSTPRKGLAAFTNIQETPSTGPVTYQVLAECFPETSLATAGDVTTIVFTHALTWTCGSAVELKETRVSWGTGNTDFCGASTADKCGQTASKCWKQGPQDVIIVETFPCTPATASALSNSTVCAGQGKTFTSTFSAAANTTITSVQWQIFNTSTNDWDNLTTSGVYTADNDNTSPATLTISDVAGLNGKQYRVLISSNSPSSGQNCSSSRSATLTVDLASVGGSVISNQTICTGTSPNDLTLSGNTGNVLRWEKASSAAFTTPTTISNTTTTLSGAAIGNLIADTWFRAVVQNGVCSEAASNSVKITVQENPSTATVGNAQDRCGSLASLGLGGNTPSVGTGTWTKKSGPGTVTFSNSNANSPNATATVSEAGTYVFTWTITNGVCNSTSADITVNYYGALSAPSVCVVQPSLCGPATGKVKFTDLGPGFQYTINGTDWQTCPVFVGVAAGAATSLKVKNSAGCESAPANCNTNCAGDPDAIVACETSGRVSQTSLPQTEAEAGLSVKAYPNPFNDRVKFVVTSSVAGNGILDVYNMTGQKVKTVHQGYIAVGTQTFELRLPTQQVANLVYVLRVGDKKMTGKILQINK